MRILYLINHAGKAGTERYVQAMAETLKNTGKATVYLGYNEDGLLRETLEKQGISCFRVSMRHPFDLVAAWKLAAYCRKEGIEIIHAQFLRENYIAALARLFYPAVRVVYTSHFILANTGLLKFTNRIISRLEHGVISVCNKGREQLIENGVSPSLISVVFNGVDPEAWQRVPSEIRRVHGLSDETFVMLCGSRFAHDKGHRFLVDAMAELKKRTSRPFHLLLLNDGPLQNDVRQQVRTLGLEDQVTFVGFCKDVRGYVSGADVYINASEHEALSFAMLEVLAAGTPLIATRMAGNPDIVNENTKCGVLVPYNEPVPLAEAVLKLMHDPDKCRELSGNAVAAVHRWFSLDTMVSGAWKVYEKAMNKG